MSAKDRTVAGGLRNGFGRIGQRGYLVDKPRDENYAKIGPTADRLFGQRNTGLLGTRTSLIIRRNDGCSSSKTRA